jgi:nitrogenase molybdenum-iron protein alpha chain
VSWKEPGKGFKGGSMALLDARKALTREKWTRALSHYHGTLASLLEDSAGNEPRSGGTVKDTGKEIQQRVRTFSQSTPGEIIYALQALSAIRNSALVIHGAPGCSVSGLWFNPEGKMPWYSTNLNESDTILGGEKKLRAAILRAHNENRPEIIFIVGTPINAINNDDIDSVILDMEKDISCRILYLEVNGFKTKNALSGYDTVYHGFLKNLVDSVKQTEKTGRPFINLLTVSENSGNILAIVELLNRLDISCNILPRFSSLQSIRGASRALLSVSLNDGENDYFLTGLEERFDVPTLRTNAPIGTLASSDFFRKISSRFDRAVRAEELIKSEKQMVKELISRKPLAESRVFIDVDLHQAAGFSSLVMELGGEISGILISHLDFRNIDKLRELNFLPGNTPVIIAQGQQFEIVNVLAKHPADYFVGKSANAAVAAVSGTKPIVTDDLVYYGYAGIREFAGKVILANGNNAYGEFLRQYGGVPYSRIWRGRSGNWYVKVEVM